MTARTRGPGIWLAYLGAVSFGLAAPVYSFVLGSKWTFQLDRTEAALLILLLQVVATVVALIARALAGKRGWLVDGLVYGGSILVFVRQVQMVVALPSTSFDLKIAALVGVPATATAISYAVRRHLVVFMSYVGAFSAILAAYFLWTCPVAAAAAPRLNRSTLGVALPTQTVYVFVFDELSLEAMLDADGRIDRAAFPSFSRLSQESVWFRQAIANYAKTGDSIPSMLTGSYLSKPATDVTRLDQPTLLDVLADNGYNVSFYSRALGCASERLNCVSYNSGTVVDKLRRTLVSAANYYVPGMILYEVAPSLATFTNVVETRQLVGAATGQAAAPGSASFLHFVFTHNPYNMFADGRPIPVRDYLHAEFREGEDATRTMSLYREQIRYADRALGIFLDRLRQSKAWDRAVVIVTADHGVCWYPGCRQRYRPLSAVEPSLARVPMLIRSPRLAPRVLDVDYQHVDFLPTVLDALRIPVPGAVDGRSAFAADLHTRPRLFFVSDDRQFVNLELPPRRVEVVR